MKPTCIYWSSESLGPFCHLYKIMLTPKVDVCEGCVRFNHDESRVNNIAVMGSTRAYSASQTMKYSKGFKYQLRENFYYRTGIRLRRTIHAPLVTLRYDGWLIIEKYFAWDGASVAPDIESSFRAALVHDALYYLMRLGLLDISWRQEADIELFKLMRDDGAWWITAQTFYLAVRALGARHAMQKSERIVYEKPEPEGGEA